MALEQNTRLLRLHLSIEMLAQLIPGRLKVQELDTQQRLDMEELQILEKAPQPICQLRENILEASLEPLELVQADMTIHMLEILAPGSTMIHMAQLEEPLELVRADTTSHMVKVLGAQGSTLPNMTKHILPAPQKDLQELLEPIGELDLVEGLRVLMMQVPFSLKQDNEL